jgi:hypothetical protein
MLDPRDRPEPRGLHGPELRLDRQSFRVRRCARGVREFLILCLVPTAGDPLRAGRAAAAELHRITRTFYAFASTRTA